MTGGREKDPAFREIQSAPLNLAALDRPIDDVAAEEPGETKIFKTKLKQKRLLKMGH